MGNEALPRVGSESPVTGSERRPEHLVGTVLAGTYRVTHRIGSGGVGHVYEAEHLRLGRSLALKVLHAELGDRPLTLSRFQREAKILATIESDYVVRVLDCGELPSGAPYFTMELLRGEDLRSRLTRIGRLSESSALRVALHACRGLAAVHAAGVIHRDLKPANLFLSRHAEDGERCKILDFGVAKALSAGDVTREGTSPGTLRYMAPEQVLQSAKPDARTDIYALGTILYEMLVGAPPHDGETAEELMFAIANRIPAAPRILRPELRSSVSGVVLRCLARSPNERFQTTDELIGVLRSLAADHGPPGDVQRSLDDTLPERTVDHDRPVGRPQAAGRPRIFLLGGVLVGSVVGFATWSVLRAAGENGSGTAEHATTVVAEGTEPTPLPAPPVVVAEPTPTARPQFSAPASSAATPSAPVAPRATKARRNDIVKGPSEFGQILEQESPYGSNH